MNSFYKVITKPLFLIIIFNILVIPSDCEAGRFRDWWNRFRNKPPRPVVMEFTDLRRDPRLGDRLQVGAGPQEGYEEVRDIGDDWPRMAEGQAAHEAPPPVVAAALVPAVAPLDPVPHLVPVLADPVPAEPDPVPAEPAPVLVGANNPQRSVSSTAVLLSSLIPLGNKGSSGPFPGPPPDRMNGVPDNDRNLGLGEPLGVEGMLDRLDDNRAGDEEVQDNPDHYHAAPEQRPAPLLVAAADPAHPPVVAAVPVQRPDGPHAAPEQRPAPLLVAAADPAHPPGPALGLALRGATAIGAAAIGAAALIPAVRNTVTEVVSKGWSWIVGFYPNNNPGDNAAFGVPKGQALSSKVSDSAPKISTEPQGPAAFGVPKGQALSSKVSDSAPKISTELQKLDAFGVPKGQALSLIVSDNTPKISTELQGPVVSTVPVGQALSSKVSDSAPKISTELQGPVVSTVPVGQALSSKVSGSTPKISTELQGPVVSTVPVGQALSSKVSDSAPKISTEPQGPAAFGVPKGQALSLIVSDNTPKILTELPEPAAFGVPKGQALSSQVSDNNPIDSVEIKEPVQSKVPQGQALISQVSNDNPIDSAELQKPAAFGVPKGQALSTKVSDNTPRGSAELQDLPKPDVPADSTPKTAAELPTTPMDYGAIQEADAFAVPKGLHSTLVSGDSSKGGGNILPKATNINSINQVFVDIQSFLSKTLDLNRYVTYLVNQSLRHRFSVKLIATGDKTKIEKGIWIKSIVANSKEQKSADGPGYNSRSHGFILGADAEFDSDLLLGSAVSNIVSTLKLKDYYSGNKTTANSKFVSLYGTKNLTKNIYISSVASLMQSDIKTSYQGKDYTGKESTTYHTQENVRGGYVDVKLHYVKKFNTKMVLSPVVGINYFKNVLPGFCLTDIKGSDFTVASLHNQRASVMVGGSLSAIPFFIRKLEIVPQINTLIDRQIYSRTGSTKITNTNGSVVEDKIKNHYKTTFSLGGSLDVNYHNTNFLIAYDMLVRRKFFGQQVSLKARLNF
jgi:outer membrane autotransporter protein